MNEQPMERAIRLAGEYRPHPNPRVGAVIVSGDGRVIGEGAHVRPGLPHAEVVALTSAGESPAGSTMYVTLEPCNHTGRTGPCAQAIIQAGVTKVVIGLVDPDARVAGTGIAALREAGIDVVMADHSKELEELDPGYLHHRRTGRPRFTLKSALTLDGQVAARDRTSQWITGEEARLDGHRLRAQSDAVLVGAGTVIDDDPRLDVRLPGYDGPQPRPVVVAGDRQLRPDAQVLERGALVVSSGELEQPGEVVVVPAGPHGRPDLPAVAEALGQLGFLDILIEAGPTLAAEMWAAGLVDRGVWYMAAKVAGGQGFGVLGGQFATLSEATNVKIIDIHKVGTDLRIEFVMEG